MISFKKQAHFFVILNFVKVVYISYYKTIGFYWII